MDTEFDVKKQPAVKGMRSAKKDIKRSYESMIEGWKR